MTRLQIRRSVPDDILCIQSTRARDEYGNEWYINLHRAIERAPHHHYTIHDGKRICAVAGVVPLLRKSAELWVVIDDTALSLPDIPRACKRVLDEVERTFDYKRIQATANSEEGEVLCRWHEYLGFVYESTMQSYDNGVDHYMYVRIR